MKQKLFKWILILGILCMSYSVVYAEGMNLIYDGENYSYSNAPIHLSIDGQQIVTKVMPPIQLNNNTLVPANEVFTTIGASVEWRASEQSVYIHNSDTLIVLQINSDVAWVNGETKQLNVPAKLINNKVMIPLRFISEALGYKVEWSPNDSTVYIKTKEDNIAQNSNESISNNDAFNTSIENTQEVENTSVNTDYIQDINTASQLGSEYLSYLGQESTVSLNHLSGLQGAAITYDENYHKNQIVIYLNGDYSTYLPEGTYQTQEGAVKKIEVTHQALGTQITLTTSTIQALMISEEEEKILLKVVKPSVKYSKIVVIDAGHGDHDPGTMYAGIKEKDLNLSMAKAVISVLEADPNIKVYATREDDTYLALKERVAFSNQIQPDLFISIHINSVDGNTKASGTETYYTISADTRNKTFATMVQKALVEEFGTRSRGVKANNLYVTKYTDAPAILIEIGFLTNDEDRAMMTSAGFEDRYAQTLYKCILDYYAAGLNNK